MLRSSSLHVDEDGRRAGVDDHVRGRRPRDRRRDHLVARADAERDEREVQRRGAARERERVPRARGTRRSAARARPSRGPVVSQPERSVSATAAISSSPTAGGWKREEGAAAYARALASTSAVTKRMRSAAAAARSRASSRDSPTASTAPARSAPPRSAPKTPARRAVDAHADDALHAGRLLDALDRAELARRRDEEAHDGAADRLERRRAPGAGTGSPSAPASASPFRSTPSAAWQSSASCPPPSRAASSTTFAARPGRRGPACTSGRSRSRALRPPRAPPRPRRRPAPRERARPDVRERDAERRRLGAHAVGDRQRVEAAVERERVHRHLRPVDELLDEAGVRRVRPRARRRPRRSASDSSVDEREAALALPVGRLDDAREAEPLDRRARLLEALQSSRRAAAARPPRAKRSRCRTFDVASTAVSGEIGCGSAEPLRDARGDPDGPVDARRDHAVDALGLGEPLDAGLVLGRDDRAPVGEREARARRDRGRRRSRRGRARARPRAARAAPAPAPRTRRRLRRRSGEPEPLSTRPRSRDTTRSVRASPSSNDVRARQPVSRSTFSVEPMWRSTWPSRSGTCVVRSCGLPSASSTTRRRSPTTEMSTPVATLSTSPATFSSGAAMIASIASPVVVDVEPVAPGVAVAVDRQRLVLQRLRDEARDHLLGMLARAVVVERPDDRDRQAVGHVVRVREPVAARLRRRVRRARVERVLLVHRVATPRCRRPRSTR